jgi:hypothetical protein
MTVALRPPIAREIWCIGTQTIRLGKIAYNDSGSGSEVALVAARSGRNFGHVG